ncbi:MAG: type II secretion system F family protein [Thermoguttaceae bacterium]
MFFSRISTRKLVDLCNRVSTSLSAGLDARTVWRNEAHRAQGIVARKRLRTVSEAVDAGADMREALAETDGYFPELFHELTHIGHQTGHLDEALAQLAKHYEFQLKIRRGFLLAMAWPLIELGISVLVIGLLIYVLGAIAKSTGTTVDVLGFGLVGTVGLIKYFSFLGVIAGVVFLIWWGIQRGLAWTRPVQRFMIRIPGLGTALESLALGRLAWAMHLTLNSGMDTRRAVALALRTTGNARYMDQMRSIDSWIEQGSSLYEAFDQAMVFPRPFLDVLHVGEGTGMVVESMQKLADQYREKSEGAMKILAVVGFFVCFGVIAAILIAVIFRIALFYIGTINDALRM